MTVCARCNDTHKMWSAEFEQWWPCTACPSPCPRCCDPATSNAYCKTTPCACSCHTSDGSGRRDRYVPATDGPLPHTTTQLREENTALKAERGAFRRLLNSIVVLFPPNRGHDGIIEDARTYLRDHP